MIPHLDLALEAAYKRSITLSINNSIELELQYFFLLQQSEQSTSMLSAASADRSREEGESTRAEEAEKAQENENPPSEVEAGKTRFFIL